MTIGQSLGLVAVLIGLAGFGVLYNMLVDWLERRGYIEGFVSLVVALGVAVTVGGVGLMDVMLDWNAGLICLVAFGFSGTPMMAGSIIRYVRARHAEMERIRHDTGEALAE